MNPRLRWASVLSLLALGWAAAGRAPASTVTDRRQSALGDFAVFFRESVRAQGVVGAGLVIVHDNEVVGRYFEGLAHLEDQRAVDEDSIFHWASITKTLTAIAIMQLRDRGLVRLDDPIVSYVPELSGVHNPFGDMKDVTIRHLMTHSAGFRAATWPWGGEEPWHPFEPLEWRQIAAMIPYTRVLFRPGSRFGYSNPGIVFLGQVIEKLTTEDYEVYVDKNVLRPLEMYRSYFDATPYHLKKYRAQGYYWKGGGLVPARPDPNTGITVSNSGLNAPLADMVKYLNFLTGEKGREEVHDSVLSRPSLQEMWLPLIPVGADDPASSMGLGFFVEDRNGRRLVGHGGDQNGFISHFYLDPDSRTAYTVAFNTLGEAGGERGDTRLLDREIRDYLLARVFPLFDEERPSPPASSSRADLILMNGTLVDGTGARGYPADLAVKDGRIFKMGGLDGIDASEKIDVRGLVVAPGFIDVHTHADEIASTPFAENFLRMGVTTVVAGNCGSSALRVGEALAAVEREGISINVATLIGHNTVRQEVMGTAKRAATPDELDRMKDLVRKAMAEGAYGLSTGLQYVPGTYAATDEIVELVRVAAETGGLYATHLRNEGTGIEGALQEAFAVGESAGARVQISHLKIDSQRHWGASRRVLELIDQARDRGLDVRADQYAYTAASSSLSIRFPSWVLEGGQERIDARLDDEGSWQKMSEEMKGLLAQRGFEDLSWAVVASYPPDPSIQGLSIAEVAARWKGDRSLPAQLQVAREMLRSGGAKMVYHAMSEEDVTRILRHPQVGIASDSAVLAPGEGSPHPRGYGNNARVLGRYVREGRIISLAEAVRKMTSLPALHFGFSDRGVIREGQAADVVVFDPERVDDPSSFVSPHAYASGIAHVLVNGRWVVRDGGHTGERPGKVLRMRSAR